MATWCPYQGVHLGEDTRVVPIAPERAHREWTRDVHIVRRTVTERARGAHIAAVLQPFFFLQ